MSKISNKVRALQNNNFCTSFNATNFTPIHSLVLREILYFNKEVLSTIFGNYFKFRVSLFY
jgi:hypothetical protein